MTQGQIFLGAITPVPKGGATLHHWCARACRAAGENGPMDRSQLKTTPGEEKEKGEGGNTKGKHFFPQTFFPKKLLPLFKLLFFLLNWTSGWLHEYQ